MIAFEQNGAAYMVTNTLLDGLSNETMIAIAKGLKPLGAADPRRRTTLRRWSKEPIGILGAGWVGLVTAACFAELGHPVVVRDVVPERIADLEAGRVPIFEPELEELIAKNRERMSFTLSIEDVFAEARIAFVCVGTPSTYSGDADLTAVWHVLDELPAFEERALLVMKSTVPVGTGEKVRHELDTRGLAHVGYVSNPEFLAEGTAIQRLHEPGPGRGRARSRMRTATPSPRCTSRSERRSCAPTWPPRR